MSGRRHRFVVEFIVREEWDPEFIREVLLSAVCSDLAFTDVSAFVVDDSETKTGEFINDIRQAAEKILKELSDRGRLDDISLEHEMLRVIGKTEKLWTRLIVMHKELSDARRTPPNPGLGS